MNYKTLSDNLKSFALHAAAVLILLTASMLALSGHSFAASGVTASGQVNASGGVNLRASATIYSEVVAQLPDDTVLLIKREKFRSRTKTARKKKWYYVRVNGMKGYVRADNVDSVKYTPVKAKITKGTAFRKGPGTSMKKLGTLEKGKTIKVYLDARPVSAVKGSSITWYRIKVDGKTGYVCSSSVKITGTVTPADETAADQTGNTENTENIENIVDITVNAFTTMSNAQFERYLANQGFPEDYKTSLRALHKKHPNWVFVACHTGITWMDAMKKETKYGVSLVYKSYPLSYRSKSKNSISSYSMNAFAGVETKGEPSAEALASAELPITEEGDEASALPEGAVPAAEESTAVPAAEEPTAAPAAEESTAVPAAEDAAEKKHDTPDTVVPDEEFLDAGLIASDEAKNAYYQVEPGWYNASAYVVAYYMDPRNFLNEDRIFMFEDLSYKSEYQTINVVNKIIGRTKFPSYGFPAKIFMNAGRKYDISPVFLAARAVQETGGSSASVNGSKSGGVVVYNPFNIGAYGSNPVVRGLAYAKKMGWTTQAKSVNGGASYLASGYISKKQNSIYFQRFNVANGLANAGTHQYMTNIMAPYSEAHITKSSYAQLGITGEPLGFIIPIYKSMPKKTKLP